MFENKVLESQLTEILYKYDSVSVKSKIDSLRFDEQIKMIQSGDLTSNADRVKVLEDSIVFKSCSLGVTASSFTLT